MHEMYRKTNNNAVLLQTIILLLEVAAAVTSRNAEVEAQQRKAREKRNLTWTTCQNKKLHEEWIFSGYTTIHNVTFCAVKNTFR